VLRILRGRTLNRLMLADITCRMIDKSSNATRLVEKLRQKALVKGNCVKTTAGRSHLVDGEGHLTHEES